MLSLELAVVPATSLILVLILGAPMIGRLKQIGAGQRVRDDGPQRHLEKEGTPTMGGVLIVVAVVAAVAIGAVFDHSVAITRMWLLLAVIVAFGAIGFADDWLKIRRGRSLGLKAREKLALQFLGAAGFIFAVALDMDVADYPGPPGYPKFPGWDWVGFWTLAVVATSNAANLADGLDGLVSGLCAIAAAGLTTASAGREAGAASLALLGACLGFLWFNRHPARVFMGDVGSLALGAAVAGIAAIWYNPAVLLGLFLVPFAEAASVIIQVISFKSTGRRVFRMSPLHHHFELSGWSERKVVLAFWTVAVAAGALTLWAHLV